MAEVAAVVVAAGRGTRTGGDLPKQFRRIGGEPMLRRTLSMLVEHPLVGAVQPVIGAFDRDLYDAASAGLPTLPPTVGGPTRQASVHAGLEALAARSPDLVLVHDAARPFATPALIARAIEAARKTGAAVPGVPVADTVKRVDAESAGRSHAPARTTPADPDAAGLRLRAAIGSAPARGRAWPRRFYRRCRARRMGRHESQCVRRRTRQ